MIAYKLRAFSGGTAVFFYVSFVFAAKISERGENGIWGCLTESAERAVFYLSTQLFEQLDISVSAAALAYPLKSFPEAHSADATGNALSARLVRCEIEKEFAMRTMQVLSSITTIPPEPIIAPVAERAL